MLTILLKTYSVGSVASFIPNILRFMAICLLSVFVSACGGDTGGGTGTNNAPVAQDISETLNEDQQSATIMLLGTDADGNNLTYQQTTDPQYGTLSITGSNAYYTPNANYNGQDSFQYKVHDGSLDSNVATVTINISAINDAPTAQTASYNLYEDNTYAFSLGGQDLDGDSLTYNVQTQTDNGVVLDCSGANCTYQPPLNFHGTDSFSYSVSDNSGQPNAHSDSVFISFTVYAVNDAPVVNEQAVNLVPPTIITDEGTTSSALDMSLYFIDLDGDTLSYRVTTQPTNGSISNSGNSYFYRASGNFYGSDSFEIVARDTNSQESSPIQVSVTVNNILDDRPVGEAQAVSLQEDNLGTSITLNATDPDGQTSFTYAVTTQPTRGSVTCGEFGSCTYTPNANNNGQDSFRFTATDAQGLTSTATTVTLNITAVDDQPTTTAQTVEVNEDIQQYFYLLYTEVDGDTKTFTITNPPVTGTVSCTNAGYCNYKTVLNSDANDSFSYTLSDGTTTTSETLVTLNVTAVDDAPLFSSVADLGSINEGGTLNYTAIATDPEGNSVTYSLFNNPAWVSIVPATGVISGTPGVRDSGDLSFQIRASDGARTGSVIASITVLDPAPPGAVIDLISQVSESAVKLSWTNPADTDISSTSILRKSDGSCPASISDGTLVQTVTYMNTASSQYSLIDDNEGLGLTRDSTYCYGVFVSDEIAQTSPITVAEATPSVGTARYALNGSNWNDYVSKNGANYIDASGSSCNKSASGFYSTCLNGGEIRQFEVPGYASCTNLTASDALGAFNWVCDASTDPVRMVSTSLKQGKGLSDLIDFTSPGWLNNTLTVSANDIAVYSTPASVWWNNPVSEVTASGSLATAGTIYVVSADLAAELTVDAPRIALVIKPGVSLSGDPGTPSAPIVSSSTVGDFAYYWREFLWFEGAINATSETGGLYLRGVTNSVLKNVSVYGAGVTIAYSTGMLIDGISVANNSGTGLYLTYTDHSIIRNVVSSNNGTGIYLTYSRYNILTDLLMFSNASRGYDQAFQSAANTLINVTAINNGTGISMWDAVYQKLINVAAIRNSTGISDVMNANYNTMRNIILADNELEGLLVAGTTNTYQGHRKVGGNARNDCINQITNGSSGCPTYTSTGISTSASFVAEVTTDTVNTDGLSGVALYDNITQWLGFDNAYRGWGLQGTAAYPDISNQGFCGTGLNCQIWDWSLALGDTGDNGAAVAHSVNALPTGDEFDIYPYRSINDEAICLALDATWDTQYSSCKTNMLHDAVEMPSDGIGNDNGLCESNETCLYTPNIGAYQGHGALISAGTFIDSTTGGITGVTLLKHTNNGY